MSRPRLHVVAGRPQLDNAGAEDWLYAECQQPIPTLTREYRPLHEALERLVEAIFAGLMILAVTWAVVALLLSLEVMR